MKYPCNMIRDLLPLYHDGVCSGESAEIVKEHLSECAECGEYYKLLCEADNTAGAPLDTEKEMTKAASFRGIRRKLMKKQFFIVLIVLVLLAAGVFTAVCVLENSSGIIEYDNNISVTMTDGSLIGRLSGNQAEYLSIKRVETNDNTFLFFRMAGTKWNDITTSEKVFSEYVLCPADKEAGNVDGVYYYTGDYNGIESLSGEELQKVMDASVLLWSK